LKKVKGEKVVYIGKEFKEDQKDSENIKKTSNECYVLYLSDDSDDNRASTTLTFFYNMLHKTNKDLERSASSTSSSEKPKQVFMIVDLEVRPELFQTEGVPEGTRICLFSMGKCVNLDIMKNKQTDGEIKSSEEKINEVSKLISKKLI
jgi:hypothetical protein